MKNKASVGALQNLVKQFASPFDSIRELVQNSIDAGTSRIDVWCDYEFTDQNGVITIHIDDFGEGMDENIIDNQLTKLFASAKENDLTKIGKFGIGFVSVFALQPAGVLLHTGRGGEYWEIFFHPDRSYTKTKIDNPVEGTQITIFLEGSPAYYDTVVKEVRGSLKKWCLYAEPEIAFENRADLASEVEYINQEFGVKGTCALVDVHSDGTEIALAFNRNPNYAFFNRGLTLAMDNTPDDLYPLHLHPMVEGLSIQIKSRYLEHTLSRDSVVRDIHFNRVMTLLSRTINQKLADIVFSRIHVLAHQESLGPLEAREYGRLLSEVSRFESKRLEDFIETPFIRLVSGPPISPRALYELFKETGRIPISENPTPMIERASDAGIPTVWITPPQTRFQIEALTQFANFSAPFSLWDATKRVVNMFVPFGKRIDVIPSDFRQADRIFYDLQLHEASPFHTSIFDRVKQRLSESGIKEIDFKLTKVYPLQYSQDGMVFDQIGKVGLERISKGAKVGKNELCINIDHESIQRIFELGKHDPTLASYMFYCAIAENLSIEIPKIDLFYRSHS